MKDKEKENKCSHQYKIIAVWGVSTYFLRRECKNCKRLEDAMVMACEWKKHIPASTSEVENQSKSIMKGFNLLQTKHRTT